MDTCMGQMRIAGGPPEFMIGRAVVGIRVTLMTASIIGMLLYMGLNQSLTKHVYRPEGTSHGRTVVSWSHLQAATGSVGYVNMDVIGLHVWSKYTHVHILIHTDSPDLAFSRRLSVCLPRNLGS